MSMRLHVIVTHRIFISFTQSKNLCLCIVENNFHWDNLLDKKQLDYYNVNNGKLPELQAWMREEWPPLLLRLSGLLLTLVVNPVHLVSSWAFRGRESESLCLGLEAGGASSTMLSPQLSWKPVFQTVAMIVLLPAWSSSCPGGGSDSTWRLLSFLG